MFWIGARMSPTDTRQWIVVWLATDGKGLLLNCQASSLCMWGGREAAFPPAATAKWEQGSNVFWALPCLDSDNRHLQALPVQMGLAGTIHLFLWSNYAKWLIHRDKNSLPSWHTPAGTVEWRTASANPARRCPQTNLHTLFNKPRTEATRPYSPNPNPSRLQLLAQCALMHGVQWESGLRLLQDNNNMWQNTEKAFLLRQRGVVTPRFSR